MKRQWPTAILSIGLAISLIGGAALWADNRKIADRAADLTTQLEDQADAHCEAIDDIHQSLVAFVREHHRITVDLREVGVFHEQVPLRETLEPLRVECATRGHWAPGHDHSEHQPGSSQGGDATGPPSGGGGQPGGGEPPPEQGVLDPIIDPVAPGADCDITVEGVILCTEPD